MTIDLFALMVVVGYPFRYYDGAVTQAVDDRSEQMCWQPITIIGVFCMLIFYWGSTAIMTILHHPFASSLDTFDIDALIAGTEQTIFSSLRATFDDAHRYSPKNAPAVASLKPKAPAIREKGQPSGGTTTRSLSVEDQSIDADASTQPTALT